MADFRYARFTALTDCSQCGQPLPLRGPATVISCSYCSQDVDLPTSIWRPILEAFDNQYESLSFGERHRDVTEAEGFRVRYEYELIHPSDASAFASDAPAWLKQMVHTAKQVVLEEEPILKPTVATVRPFYIRFEGASKTQQAEADRRSQERAQKAQAQVQREQQEVKRLHDQASARMRGERERIASLQQVSRAFRAATLAALALALLVVWFRGSESLFSMTIDGEQGLFVSFGVAVFALITTIRAMHLVGQPVAAASGNDSDWMLFITWFWLPFSLMPGIGSLLALWRGIVLYRGKFAAATIESNGSSSSYDAVELQNGEGKPGGVLFFALSIAGAMFWLGALSALV